MKKVGNRVNKKVFLLIGILMLGTLVSGVGDLFASSAQPPQPIAFKSTTELTVCDAIEYGDPKAPVVIELYFSSACDHCGDFFAKGGDFESIKASHIDTGKVLFKFFLIPLNVVKSSPKNLYTDSVIIQIANLKSTNAACQTFFDKILLFTTHQKEWFPKKEEDFQKPEKWKENIIAFATANGFNKEDVECVFKKDLGSVSTENDKALVAALIAHSLQTVDDKGMMVSPTFYIGKKGNKPEKSGSLITQNNIKAIVESILTS